MICAAFIPVTYLFYPETANRTLEDIDRFFETKPGIIIARNPLATQLSRPEIYAEQDAAIARGAEKSGHWDGDEEKAGGDIAVEKLD